MPEAYISTVWRRNCLLIQFLLCCLHYSITMYTLFEINGYTFWSLGKTLAEYIVRSCKWPLGTLVWLHLGIAIPIPEFFSNPEISGLKNANLGIESREWVPDFELVKISSNSLFLVSWWVLESWSICWSPILTYYYVNNRKYLYLSSFLSYDTS